MRNSEYLSKQNSLFYGGNSQQRAFDYCGWGEGETTFEPLELLK
jgi:hypothetical protein